MRNIFKIILRDFKAITTNVVALVIVMGLCVVPCLYAWFNINSNWDPYGEEATSNLVIAVYSADEGITIANKTLNIGDSVVDALKGNSTIGWVFPEDERTAINGVYSGDYYAALVVPADFTKQIAGIVKGELSGGTITYYANEKKNSIGTKITGKAKTTVQNQVNSTVFSTITEIAASVGQSLDKSSKGNVFSSMHDSLSDTKEDLNNYIETIDVLNNTVDTALLTMSGVTELNEKIVKDLTNDIHMVSSASMAMSTAGIETANLRLEDYITLLQEGQSDMNKIADILKDMYEDVEKLESDLVGVEDSEALETILDVLQNDPEKLGTFFATPVDMQTEAIFPIETYGSQMASFYTVLAIWFGSLILVAIIHTKVHPFEGYRDGKHYQEFFGRYAVFFFIGQIQALLCCLGDLFFMEIQCVHKLQFWAMCALASFAFTLFIYSLTFAFGNVGEALAVVVMVIQVAGAGGTFPKECLPEVFQMVYKFLPWTYVMDGLKECIGGMYVGTYLNSVRFLLVFMLVSLFIGLVLSIPFKFMNHLMEESKEKTGFMV